MAADLEHNWQPLARELENRLRTGFTLKRDTLRFMASTFAIESPPDLDLLLGDPEDSDVQTLLELLFSPDENTRVDLEEIIGQTPCTTADEQAIVNDLFQKKLEVPIRFPETAAFLSCSPTRDLLETWVRGLHITVRLPEELAASITDHLSGRFGFQVKAALRISRVELSQTICAFLGRLLAKSELTGQVFLEDLDLCLSVFSKSPDNPSLFDLFMAEKRRLLIMLQQAEKFEKQLAAHNIETLMLRGVRTPHIDITDTRRRITRIDAICLMVFGVTDPLLQVPTTADLGSVSNRDDLDRAFEILS